MTDVGEAEAVTLEAAIEAVTLEAAIAAARERLAAARSPDVRADDAWAAAGVKVLRFHFARMLVRVPGVVAGEDPEEVHAMRVATRRMRAAWRVFGGGFDREVVRAHRRDAREVGGRLGAVRDLDVLMAILDAYLADHGARAQSRLLPLRVAWYEERLARHGELVDHLGSPAFAAFVTETDAFLSSMPATADAPAIFGRVRARMPAAAWAAYGDLRAFEEHLPGADLATLHQLRIAGKWLRYTLEFAREALGSDAQTLIAPIVALQDHLGEQHDLHVAATLARAFVAQQGSLSQHDVAATERFAEDLDARVVRADERLARTWKRIVAPGYRARLGRSVARL